jgi:hypothetical protein
MRHHQFRILTLFTTLLASTAAGAQVRITVQTDAPPVYTMKGGILGFKWVMALGASPQIPGIYRFGTNPEAGIMKRGAVLTPRLSLGP